MKTRHIIFIFLIIVIIGIVISTLYNADTYSDFKTAKASPGKEFQISGSLDKSHKVIEDSINLIFTFYLKDRNSDVEKVIYHGSKPKDFEKISQIIISGKYSENQFNADKLMLKCPSKYSKNTDTIFSSK